MPYCLWVKPKERKKNHLNSIKHQLFLNLIVIFLRRIFSFCFGQCIHFRFQLSRTLRNKNNQLRAHARTLQMNRSIYRIARMSFVNIQIESPKSKLRFRGINESRLVFSFINFDISNDYFSLCKSSSDWPIRFTLTQRANTLQNMFEKNKNEILAFLLPFCTFIFIL